MSSKNFYGLTGDVTVDGGILNVGNAQLYANTETSNVGVGTSNPEFQLDVHGDANVGVLYSTFLHGDGSNIQNIVSSQWEGSPGDPIYYASNVGIANTSPVTTTMQIGSNVVIDDVGSNVIHVTGNIYADYLVGDGSQLTGIAASLDQIVDQGNTVSNTIQIVSGQDATSNVGLVTHEGVGISISNTNPTGEFQFGVGSNLLVNVYSSNVLTVDGNVFAQKMTLGTVTVTPAYNLQQIMTTGATTNQTLVLSNATTGLTTASNVGIANTAPVHTLDVGSNLYVEDTGSNVLTVTGNAYISGDVNIGSNLYVEDTGSNVLTVTGNAYVTERLDVGSNLHIENLRVAEVAANLVTYDSATGELMDSAGLFSNKLAVVSEQPPVALTGASTVVAKHGTYAIEASSGTVVNLFDKVIGEINKWETVGNYSTDEGTEGDYNGSASLAGYDGEWVKITMPYKTILRHVKIESTNQSVEDIKLVGLNSDGLTWSVLKTVTGLIGTTHTIIVNATTHHKTYGLIVEKTNTTTGRSAAEIGDLKLFTESFSIDGGKVEMASSAVMGGETTMDQHGPHGRDGAAVLKKYPEIAFDASKYDQNHSTNTYVQAGYTVTASSQRIDDKHAANLYEDNFPVTGQNDTWQTEANMYDLNGDATSDYALGGRNGSYTTLELPHKIKLSYIQIQTRNSDDFGSPIHPKQIFVYGSINGSSWTQVGSHLFTSIPTSPVWQKIDINSTTPYNYFALQVTSVLNNEHRTSICQLRYYGYEEDPPAGDTSVDATFKSVLNTPQTTGAQVYVDGSLGETFTNRVTGPDATGPSATYDSTGKYWELNGTLTSNIAVEANTFLEGDQPHAVSVWFNSSNLEANVSNTCVFSVSDQEKLDSVNLDLQSNTWHNLTYAYQGEGGSRVTYLDGRKVAEDQAEDTFGEYPPFEIGTYSLGGYTVDASYWNTGAFPARLAYNMFQAANGARVTGWTGANIPPDPADANYDTTLMTLTDTSGTAHLGHWVSLELPYKLSPSYCEFEHYGSSYRLKDFVILGSNDDPRIIKTGFTLLFSGQAHVDNNGTNKTIHAFTGSGKFKYLILLTKTLNTGNSTWVINRLRYYGHRENDLVRLPDPTNVLKYPHIAMTGPAQRGYVASASSSSGSSYRPWRAFNDIVTSNDVWTTTGGVYNTNTGLYSAGVYSTTVDGHGTAAGEFLQIEFPHKIKPTKFRLSSYPATTGSYRQPRDGVFAGSNNGTDWVLLKSYTNQTSWSSGVYVEIIPDTNTTNSYKYLRLIVTNINTNNDGVCSIHSWQTLGTGVDSVPIQIGGGNIDKVANFRVYDKFVGEDQALEIWDAQKDEFDRAKSSMTLQKGRLGIGTTEPEGRLAVADEPSGLEEFPPRAMTSNETYFEGHGVFKTSVSSRHSSYYPWQAFDRNIADTASEQAVWHTAADFTNATPGIYNAGASLGGYTGAWLKLKLPYSIKPSKVSIHPRTYPGGTSNFGQNPLDFLILGSKDDITWDVLSTQVGVVFGTTWKEFILSPANNNYNYFAISCTKTKSGSYFAICDMKYFGTREQGQSVLHDGQLTLTKSLNVPRIGPALDADDTPRRDRLVVEYNTSTNPTFEGAVRDTSGRGNDGAFYGGASYDATDKALVFDGVDDRILTRLQNPAGESLFSGSLWFKTNTATEQGLVWIGSEAAGKAFVFKYNGDDTTPNFEFSFYGNDCIYNYTLTFNTCYHIAFAYSGGTASSAKRVWVNGTEVALTSQSSTSALNLDANAQLMIGDRPSNGADLNGTLSNFKLYDTALTAEEVKTLYDMGRCDEGHHVVNFSKTRVGIGLGDGEAPRGALDVQGIPHGPNSRPCWRLLGSGINDDDLWTWSTVQLDNFGGASGSTYYTIPVSGYYFMQVVIIVSAIGSRAQLNIRQNGVSVGPDFLQDPITTTIDTNRPWNQLTGMITHYFNAGDQITVYTSGSSYGGHNCFTGFHLGF
jgi:hypothetical protein